MMARDEEPSAHDARKLTDADRFVGQRLRQARREIGLTQDRLAAALRDIAVAVAKPIDFFFEPIAGESTASSESGIKLLMRDLRRDAKRLVDQIQNPDDLKTVVRVLEILDRVETPVEQS